MEMRPSSADQPLFRSHRDGRSTLGGVKLVYAGSNGRSTPVPRSSTFWYAGPTAVTEDDELAGHEHNCRVRGFGPPRHGQGPGARGDRIVVVQARRTLGTRRRHDQRLK